MAASRNNASSMPSLIDFGDDNYNPFWCGEDAQFNESSHTAHAPTPTPTPNVDWDLLSHDVDVARPSNPFLDPEIAYKTDDKEQVQQPTEHHHSDPYDSFSESLANTSFSPNGRGRSCVDNQSPQKRAAAKETVGAGGDQTIFKAPVREAISARRPCFLEVRPHPLRETQDGKSPLALASTDTALWAGLECGIAVWPFAEMPNYHSSSLSGDEDAAPFSFYPLHQSATTCFLIDNSRDIMWSGHRDGWVRAWPINLNLDSANASPLLSWQACDFSLLSMFLSAHGELWIGCENGVLRTWEGGLIDFCLSSSHGKNSFQVALELQSHANDVVDPFANNVVNKDKMSFVLDRSRNKVWSVGSSSLVLWDVQAREIIKSIGADGQIEFNREMAVPEDNYNARFARVTSKEKGQGALGLFQRSKNMLMGAAGAVCRATLGSQFLDDGKKIQSVVASGDGTFWTGHANGLLVHWNFSGQRLGEFQHLSVGILCLLTLRTQLWAGYEDGRLHVMEQNGKVLKEWFAHKSGVKQMAAGTGHIFTLAIHGGIRGWCVNASKSFDITLRSALLRMEHLYTTQKHVKLFASTWNVGQARPSFASLRCWLETPAAKADIVVIGLQEMEMGAGVLAMAAARETVGMEGSANGIWWLDNIGGAIGNEMFALVGSRQLAGLLIGAWVRKELLPYVGDVDIGAVACGFGRALGNKGAVAIKMRVFRKSISIVNCHFAAHAEALSRRNADFEYIYRSMTFGRVSSVVSGVSSAFQTFLGGNARKPSQYFDMEGSEIERGFSPMSSSITSLDERPELSEVDMAIWLGDFNYRLNNVSYEDALYYIRENNLQTLLKFDQLRAEMSAGHVFQGMRESFISFPPTYKFDPGETNPQAYDSSEKRRVPAWCDRILFRDNRGEKTVLCALSCPVVALVEWYDSCVSVFESDHKPVMCMFDVSIAFIDEAARRTLYWDLYTQAQK